MPEPPTNLTSFAPEEYSAGWTHEQLAARYIDLRAGHLALRNLSDGAAAARPFERERTIHNLQNARLRLENEKQQLCAQIRQIERANQTNRNINRDLREQYMETQETLNMVLQAQFQVDQEAREQHAKIERLEEENKSLHWQVQMLVKSRDENEESLAGSRNKGGKLRPGVDEMGKKAQNTGDRVDEVTAEQEKMTKAKLSGQQSYWDDNHDDDYNDDHFDI